MKRVLTAWVAAVVVTWSGFCQVAAENELVMPSFGQSEPMTMAGSGRPATGKYLAADSVSSAVYHNNGNGTVTDVRSGLIWQQTDDGRRRTWQAAVAYCADLTLGGYGDWRLPTRRELYSIKTTSSRPMFQSSHCWSGSSLSTDGQIAWVVLVGHGYVYPRNKDDHYYVRCVL